MSQGRELWAVPGSCEPAWRAAPHPGKMEDLNPLLPLEAEDDESLKFSTPPGKSVVIRSLKIPVGTGRINE